MTFPGEVIKTIFSDDSTFSSPQLAFFAETNGYYVREWMAGMAMPIRLKKLQKYFPGVRYRFGAKFKFLQGIAAVYTNDNNAELIYDENGIPVTLDYDYTFHEAINEDDFSPFEMNGWGLATD